ncbi:hypothetical protein F5B17DRAFT_447452 [Nemania serpens]|nr:hypothetical protein F5B17DRAFT_447452 [Nemania serpens]
MPPMYTDQPLSLIPTLKFQTGNAVGQDDAFTIEASHMALSNNALIRGFNSIYQQAPHLSLDADKSDFVGYCISWAECVLTHYEYETCNLFLGIEKAARERGLMNSHSSLEGHLFYVELDSIRRYLLYIRFRGFGFSSTELLRLMDRFKKMFHEHLKSKPLALAAIVEYSTPGNPIDIHRIVETAERKQLEEVDWKYKFNTLPVFFLNMETATFEDGMWHEASPPMKGSLRGVPLRLVSMWKLRRWRFASCAHNGRLKPLAV